MKVMLAFDGGLRVPKLGHPLAHKSNNVVLKY